MRISDQKLDEIIAGIDELPCQSWIANQYEDGDDDAGGTGEWSHDGTFSWLTPGDYEPQDLRLRDKGVAEHIERLDPVTARAIATELKILRALVQGMPQTVRDVISGALDGGTEDRAGWTNNPSENLSMAVRFAYGIGNMIGKSAA